MPRKTEDTKYISDHLNEILACLRAQNLSYQTSHWQSKGSSFYQDHLLFERLYNSVLEEIDQLAEKIAGLVGSDQVGLDKQSKRINDYLNQWNKIPNHLERGLASEYLLQDLLLCAAKDLEDAGLLSLGLDDYLAATASSHETNIYLLQQALDGEPRNIQRRKNPSGKSLLALGALALFVGTRK